MTDSRYPYTHAADFIRRVGPVSSSGVVLSRGDASAIRGAIAVAIQIEDFRLACMLADAELEYQENSEAVQKETERVLRAIRGGSMTDLYSSTVPPAVLQKLRSTAPTSGWPRDAWIAEQAAQWGADQELDACCEWLEQNQGRWEIPMALRDARRPKPPSLKEQAFKDLDELLRIARQAGVFNPPDNIRRALEALPE